MKNKTNKKDIMKVKEPSLYRVLMHQDDFTPREFAVKVLENLFGMDRIKATTVMATVRERGIALCGKFTKDVAMSLQLRAIDYARKYQQPLLCSMEVD